MSENGPHYERLEPRLLLSAGWDVVAIDTQLPDWEHFVAAAINAEQFVLYDGENDTLSDVLQRATEEAASSGNEITSFSILSHGQEGQFSLGNEWVSEDNLANTAQYWSELGRHMSDEANIYIFGCNVASADGQLVDALADLTGADIFASDDLTGAGGDWDLEVASNILPVTPQPSLTTMKPYGPEPTHSSMKAFLSL